MRNYSKFIILLATVCIGSMQLSAEQMDPKKITLTAKAKEQLAGKQILYIEREQTIIIPPLFSRKRKSMKAVSSREVPCVFLM